MVPSPLAGRAGGPLGRVGRDTPGPRRPGGHRFLAQRAPKGAGRGRKGDSPTVAVGDKKRKVKGGRAGRIVVGDLAHALPVVGTAPGTMRISYRSQEACARQAGSVTGARRFDTEGERMSE